MRHVLSLAAFAAVSMNSAQADDGVPAVRPDAPCTGDGCPGHKPKAPAPVPAPAPAEPEPEVVPPAPAPAEPAPVAPVQGDIEVILPPAETERYHGADRFRIGGSLGVRGGLWTVPGGILDGRDHLLPAGEIGPGVYLGYQSSTDPGGIYVGFGGGATYGSLMTVSWSGDLELGAVATRGVTLGLKVGGLTRDLAVSQGQYNARFTGGSGAVFGIIDLAPKADGILDASVVPDMHMGFGSVRNPVTDVTLTPAPDFGVGLALRVGLHSN